MDTGYREVVLSGRWEPLLVAAVLAESGLFGAYVIYERPGELRLAADPLGEVTVEDGSVRRSWLGTTHREPLGARPFAQLGRVLSTVPQAGWTAYGYAGFEWEEKK